MRVTICSNPLLTPRLGLPSLIFHVPVLLKNESKKRRRLTQVPLGKKVHLLLRVICDFIKCFIFECFIPCCWNTNLVTELIVALLKGFRNFSLPRITRPGNFFSYVLTLSNSSLPSWQQKVSWTLASKSSCAWVLNLKFQNVSCHLPIIEKILWGVIGL